MCRIYFIPFYFLFFLMLSARAQSSRAWATYYGSSGIDQSWDVATDLSGNVYMAGFTQAASNIASGGFQNTYSGGCDAFLVKFDPNGNRIWATYYGGACQEWGLSVTTDLNGNVFLAGLTCSASGISSGGFQNTYGGGNDAFLVKFDANGNRLWATYYGGPGDDAFELMFLSTDPMGNVYLASSTNSLSNISSGFFQSNYGGGNYDAYLVKFDPNGDRLWSTYFGGNGDDYARAVCCDQTGNVYLSGRTTSSGLAYNGFQSSCVGVDAFLMKMDASGNRLWSTYYGGPDLDESRGVAADSYGNVYIAGMTGSTTSFAYNGYQNNAQGAMDAFLVKFSPSGNRIWATYFGGNDNDWCTSVMLDNQGFILIAGATLSSSGIASGGFQLNYGGDYDSFLARFDSTGSLSCSTYYGGPGEDWAISTASDGNGNVYLSGVACSPGLAFNGFQNSSGGNRDAYLLKLYPGCSPPSPVGNMNSTLALNSPTLESGSLTSTSDLANEQNASIISLFPNPSAQAATVILQHSGSCNVLISTCYGQQLKYYHLEPGNNMLELDCSLLADGIYFLSLQQNEKTLSTKKLVVAR
jgi:hypothetical protein